MITWLRSGLLIGAIIAMLVSLLAVDAASELGRARAAWRAGDFDQGIRLARRARWLTNDAGIRRDATRLWAEAALHSGHDDQALELFDEVLELAPDDYHSRLQRARLRLDHNQPAAALEDIERSLSLIRGQHPGQRWLADLHAAHALALARLQRDDDALREARTAIGLHPESATALRQLGEVFERQQRYRQAERCYTRAYERAMRHDIGYVNTTAGRRLSDKLVEIRVGLLESRHPG